ncbi:MAG: hypothetical protein O7D91_08025 [Planctomycetota bacterium]|nr:hypothetical protein [Planctomycetota bacterium]
MPENATTVHLISLLGKLYIYDCEALAALTHDIDRRAARLAKMEGGFTQKQERLLVLVYQGSRDFAYLRGADEDLYRRVQTFCGEAEDELRKERAKSRGRSELQLSVWKYAEQAIYKLLSTKTEMFGEGWLRKHGLRFSTTDLSSCDGDDAILNELDELHRRGVTLELLRDIWR